MTEWLSRIVSRTLVAWIMAVRRRAALVVALGVLATGGSIYYLATRIAFTTDTTALLSDELPFRQRWEEFKRLFPGQNRGIIVVLDGATPDLADAAASALVERLQRRPDLFTAVSYPQGDPFFVRNGLLYMEVEKLADLSDRLAEAQPLLATLNDDFSLRGLFSSLGLAVDEIVKGREAPGRLTNVFDKLAEAMAAETEGRRHFLSWQELMQGRPATAEDRRRIVLLRANLDRATLSPAGAAIRAVRQEVKALDLTEANGVRVRLTGSNVLSQDELRVVSEQVGLASVGSFALVALLVVIGMRSGRLIVAALTTLFMGLAWTGAAGLFVAGQFNLISVAFGVLFIGLGIDFCLHFGLRYQEELALGRDQAESMRTAAATTGASMLQSALCAAIGFFSFAPTSFVGLSQLGVISGLGMFLAVFAALSVLPAMLTLLPLTKVARFALRQSAPEPKRRRGRDIAVVAIGAASGIVAAIIALQSRFDFDPIHLNDPGTESVQAYLDLARRGGTSPYTIQIVVPDLDAAVTLAQNLKQLDSVDSAQTLASYVAKEQDAKLSIVETMALFMTPLLLAEPRRVELSAAERREALSSFAGKLGALGQGAEPGFAESARTLRAAIGGFLSAKGGSEFALAAVERNLLLGLPERLARLGQSLGPARVAVADLPDEIRDRFTAVDGRTRVQVAAREDLSNDRALRRFVTEVRRVAPEATDTPVILLEAGDAVMTAFGQAAALSLVAIFIFLALLLPRITDAVLVLMPLALAGAWTLAAGVLLDIPFNFANMIVLPLLLGLGVAYGIYLVMRRSAEGKQDVHETSTPRAVLFSALTTLASFVSLAVSTHRGMASMGQLLTIAIAGALVAELAVLAALLRLLGSPRTKGKGT